MRGTGAKPAIADSPIGRLDKLVEKETKLDSLKAGKLRDEKFTAESDRNIIRLQEHWKKYRLQKLQEQKERFEKARAQKEWMGSTSPRTGVLGTPKSASIDKALQDH